jgi:hypothetical protein
VAGQVDGVPVVANVTIRAHIVPTICPQNRLTQLIMIDLNSQLKACFTVLTSTSEVT